MINTKKVVFAFGVGFIYRLASEAEDITAITLNQLDKKIENLICEGFDRVCIGKERQAIKKKDFGVFGIKILNILDEEQFEIEVRIPDPLTGLLGYDKNNLPINNPPNPVLEVKYREDLLIPKNQEKNIGIGVQVPSGAVEGTYILDVIIRTAGGQDYVNVQKLYIEVS